mmetsp:Transcript_66760/g.178030  ORF Transcript_66760/g.178030 Transcript_66760/m.178030 type:complete len:441 (+) Transcript_66760:27-1349(+)
MRSTLRSWTACIFFFARGFQVSLRAVTYNHDAVDDSESFLKALSDAGQEHGDVLLVCEQETRRNAAVSAAPAGYSKMMRIGEYRCWDNFATSCMNSIVLTAFMTSSFESHVEVLQTGEVAAVSWPRAVSVWAHLRINNKNVAAMCMRIPPKPWASDALTSFVNSMAQHYEGTLWYHFDTSIAMGDFGYLLQPTSKISLTMDELTADLAAPDPYHRLKMWDGAMSSGLRMDFGFEPNTPNYRPTYKLYSPQDACPGLQQYPTDQDLLRRCYFKRDEIAWHGDSIKLGWPDRVWVQDALIVSDTILPMDATSSDHKPVQVMLQFGRPELHQQLTSGTGVGTFAILAFGFLGAVYFLYNKYCVTRTVTEEEMHAAIQLMQVSSVPQGPTQFKQRPGGASMYSVREPAMGEADPSARTVEPVFVTPQYAPEPAYMADAGYSGAW